VLSRAAPSQVVPWQGSVEVLVACFCFCFCSSHAPHKLCQSPTSWLPTYSLHGLRTLHLPMCTCLMQKRLQHHPFRPAPYTNYARVRSMSAYNPPGLLAGFLQVGSKITCTILGHFFETLNFVPKSPFELPKVAMVPI
jgi:hypothetical protein